MISLSTLGELIYSLKLSFKVYIYVSSKPGELLTETFTKIITYKLNNCILIN